MSAAFRSLPVRRPRVVSTTIGTPRKVLCSAPPLASKSRTWSATHVDGLGSYSPRSGMSGNPCDHAHGGAVGGRADLHEIREVVRDPEPATADGVDRWEPPTGERVGDVPGVAHLAHQRRSVAPHPYDAGARCVQDRVR